MKQLIERNTMGLEELTASQEVVKSGNLSDFIGAWHKQKFFGGNRVQQFEQSVCELFNVKHAVSVNSWTSGLIAMVAALGLEPGDEIITTPWTMSATAMAILHNNCIPVFADINPQTYNLEPECVRKLISPKTKAVLAVDIFGLSADMEALRDVCNEFSLFLLSDSAQAPGAQVGSQYAGTLADIGGFSFNYHKHIHCGEGGVIVTDNDHLATRCKLLRNHAESVVGDLSLEDQPCMVGYNFRMTEIDAAIACEQLPKLAPAVNEKQRQADILFRILKGTPGMVLPLVPESFSHAYYIFGIQLDCSRFPDARERLVRRLGENFPLVVAYQNIHRLPIFLRKQIYRHSRLPWSLNPNEHSYGQGTCPNAELLFDQTFVGIPLCQYQFTDGNIEALGRTLKREWEMIHGAN
ncbi:DegT/DnrJ/EryC1/StrS family aminotransferase [Litorivicinus sp.]|nr:DegT/DnrJ/EryC1/StrS family aminotransferase [Litorivicinus sp.]